MPENRIGEEWDLNASGLNWALSDTVDQGRREDCSWNVEFFVCFKDGYVDIAMDVIFDWEGGDLYQVGDVMIDLLGRLP